MKLALSATGVVALVAVAAVGVLYLKRKAIAETVATSFNPASDQNLAYRGVNSIGASVTGDSDFTLGGAIYDLFNGDTNQKIADMLKGGEARAAQAATSGRIVTTPAPPRDEITDLFLDPYGYSNPI